MMPPGHEPPPERVQLESAGANRWQLVDAGVSPRNIARKHPVHRIAEAIFSQLSKEGAGTGRMYERDWNFCGFALGRWRKTPEPPRSRVRRFVLR